MLLTELCERLPGAVLSRRTAKEEIALPELLQFLTAPGALRADVLYLLDAETGLRVLPECSAAFGATVLCAGALPETVVCRVNVNLVSVDCGLLELHNAAAAHLTELRRSSGEAAKALGRRFAAIVEDALSDEFQAEELCKAFPKRIRSSYCIICVEPEQRTERTAGDEALRGDLAALFPEDNITSYGSDIVVIHSYDGFSHPPELPLEALTALLRRHGARAGVSNGRSHTSGMRMMYLLAKRSLESGKIIFRDERNVYFYDDTMLFGIVSMAAVGFREQFSSDDMLLLGSPIFVKLMKRDPKGKRQLLETLFYYILNGGSTAKTAEMMHMHRNTVLRRISVIEEITGGRLASDGMLQAKLLVTYFAVQYYTRVLNKNLVLSPAAE